MPILETAKASLYYEFDGIVDAPVLILSNSLGTSLAMWEPQIQAFTHDYRVLRYDMRGHGKSSTPQGSYSIEDLAGDVVALLNGLGLQCVHFCGLSIGGVIGQFLAAHSPSRLERIVLCNTAAKIGTHENWNLRIAKVQEHGMASVADDVLAVWFTQGFRATQRADVERMRYMLTSTDSRGYVATCAAVRDMDQRGILPSISSPVCILAGEYDTVTTVADGEALHQAIPCSTLKVIPGAHISNIEAPQAFNAAVLDFLQL